MTPRARDRRARRGSIGDITVADLPVHDAYVHALIARGARLRGVSRWLNAASVEIAAAEAPALASLPFVSSMTLVPKGRPPALEETVEAPAPLARSPRNGPESATRIALVPGDPAYYGGAFKQLDMMQVPQLHSLGLSGAGVLVCMLDSGFHITHQAFAGLNVVATRDFINGDLNVDSQAGQDSAGQVSHGTETLSCVAGNQPGVFSGGAFGASVALGKTEFVPSETPIEMDYWQFGAEWADSLGADVISSSLGYSEFDNPIDSYTYADMDGRTTVVTLAALEAARRGITVVTAAGNERATAWHFLIAPGDADSVITSGAVDSFNVVANFSSPGPTADGRIKPDVSAMGRSVLTVSPTSNTTYVRTSGTSFSTPLTASLVALLLESHPAWGPFEVREALRETALNHASPNNDVGWGLVQGLAANAWVPSTTGVPDAALASGPKLSVAPNPLRAGSPVTIRFAAATPDPVRLEVFDVGGRRRARIFEGTASSERSIAWRPSGDGDARLEAGVYWIRLAPVSAASRASAKARAVRIAIVE
jgi:subtilisin family serine protease